MVSPRRKIVLILPFVLFFIAVVLALVYVLAPFARLSLGSIGNYFPMAILALVLAELLIAFFGWSAYSLYRAVTARNALWWKAVWIIVILVGVLLNSLGGLVYLLFGDWERTK